MGRGKHKLNKTNCNKCSVDLIVGVNWSISNKKQGGYKCILCQREYDREYVKNNLNTHKKHCKKWQLNNPDKYQKIYDDYKSKISAGIYGIFNDCKLIYIGQSHRPNNRRCDHFTIIGAKGGKIDYKGKSNISIALTEGKLQRDNLVFKMLEFIDDKHTRKQREAVLIQRYKPLYNSDMYYHIH